MITSAIWPKSDYSRAPYRLYHDPAIYKLEQERIFQGPTWSLIGLEAEIPRPGDFRTSYIGEVPIVFNRDSAGGIKAFVNLCSHRGALVRREVSGNATDHTCIYHQWCFAHDGSLLGVPFRRGVNGKGGYDKNFDPADRGLRKVKVDSVFGVLFATLSDEAEPIEQYLGEAILGFMKRIFDRPVKVLGYHRQRIRGNWKGFAVNPRDNYHAGLLHDFFRIFGLDRPTQVGGATMDARHRHCVTWGRAESDTEEFAQEQYGKNDGLDLAEPAIVEFRRERADDLNLAIVSLFPNCVVAQIANSFATRQIRVRGPGEYEIFQTILGYADDSPDMTRHRLRQANLVGPAGLVSMEDGEACEIQHRATKGLSDDPSAAEFLELGGGGEIGDRDYRVTDVTVRGFWSYYAEVLGIEPEGAVR
jgi:anthranilate 1,2-dioxygenase large subunit